MATSNVEGIVKRLKIYSQSAGKVIIYYSYKYDIQEDIYMNIFEIGDYIYLVNLEWKPIIIDGMKTNYEVSNIGDVRNAITKKILSKYMDKDGYLHSTIVRPNGNQYHPGIHRFVATAFIPNPDNKPEVNHINGKKYINVDLNLEWSTTSENILHAFRTGLKTAIVGSSNSLSHYTDKQIHEVCKLLEQRTPNNIISELTGVERKYITDIKKGRRWKHISKLYNIPEEKYPKDMKLYVEELLLAGYDKAEILDILNLDLNNKNFEMVKRIDRKIKLLASTTIQSYNM